MSVETAPLRSYGFEANGSKLEVRVQAVVKGVIYYTLRRDGQTIVAEGRSEQNETEKELVERTMKQFGV